MIKNYFVFWFLVFALILSGCSIELDQLTNLIPNPQSVPGTLSWIP